MVPLLPLPARRPGPWLASEIAERCGSGKAPAQLVRAGLLVRITHGACYEAEAWAGLSDDERHLAIVAAHHAYHARRGRPDFDYSHLSAARVHGLDLWEPDELVHVTAPQAVAHGRRRPEVLVHSGWVPDVQRGVVNGLPVTSLERTMVDSARILRPGQAQIVMDHGLRLGARRDVLEGLVAEASGSRGIVTARRALELSSGASESAAESLLNYLIAGLPIPKPQQQIRVVTRFGVHRIDTGWPAIKRAIEIDGRKKYFDYAPTEEVIFRERQREKALMEDDWGLLRLEWKDLFRPVELEQRIRWLILTAGDAGEALLRAG